MAEVFSLAIVELGLRPSSLVCDILGRRLLASEVDRPAAELVPHGTIILN